MQGEDAGCFRYFSSSSPTLAGRRHGPLSDPIHLLRSCLYSHTSTINESRPRSETTNLQASAPPSCEFFVDDLEADWAFVCPLTSSTSAA